MDVKELLQRYHIAPLQYDDGTVLEEKDYFTLSNFLLKYYYAKKMVGSNKIPRIQDNLIGKVERHCKRCLFEITIEDLMDILMEQEGGNVL